MKIHGKNDPAFIGFLTAFNEHFPATAKDSEEPDRKCYIKTEDINGMTAFDLARFFSAQLMNKAETVIWITEKGPFTESEELFLFNNFLNKKIECEAIDLICFNPEDHSYFVTILALCLLFRWDFFLIRDMYDFIAKHSHDNGISIYCASSEMLSDLSIIGYRNENP